MAADQQLRAAIDELTQPLIDDHYRYLARTGANPVVVSQAHLHYVTNQYGTQMLDFSARLAPVGHNHPFVVDALKEHLRYYIRTAPTGAHIMRWPTEYARNIVESFATEDDPDPNLKVLFTEGEHEAMDVARVAANRPGKWTSYVPLVDKYGTLTSKDEVQAFVQDARDRDQLVIFDESKLGFGRLGTMWAQQHYDVKPDFTVLGGPLGGGLALGAVVASPEAFSYTLPYVSQQAGSPLACAAGANQLRALNPGVLEHVKEAGAVFAEALREISDQFPGYVVTNTGAGLWQTIEFQSELQAQRFEVDARRHELLVSPPVGSSLTLTPPLIASTEEITRGVDLIADTLLEWGDELL